MVVVAFGLKKYNMNFIKNIIKSTVFYKNYQLKKEANFQLQKKQDEERLLPKAISFYKQFIQENELVFDVGANIGNRVKAFLAIKANVVAVEPQPQCYTVLENQFPQIKVEKIALASTPGSMKMHIANDSTISTLSPDFIKATSKERFKSYTWNQTIDVQVSTLNNLIELHGKPAFCKIDVEGFELEVLKGLTQPIPCLSIEYCVPEMQQALVDCVDYLHQLQIEGLFNYSIEETMEFHTSWMTYAEFKKHISTEAFEETLFGDVYFKTENI